MDIAHPHPAWLIPPALAIVFLFWVLWQFRRDERRQRLSARSAQSHILVSTAERDCRPASLIDPGSRSVPERVIGPAISPAQSSIINTQSPR